MDNSKNLFTEFPEIGKAGSLDKLKADLKGKLYESLQWEAGTGITMDPVYFREDSPEGLSFPAETSNDWLIGEKIPDAAAKMRNASLLDTLLKGVQSPEIEVNLLKKENVPILFSGVETGFIQCHFVGNNEKLMNFVNYFYEYHQKDNKDTASLNGAFCFNPESESPDFLRKAIKTTRQYFPEYKFLNIEAESAGEDPAGQLSALTKQAINSLDSLQNGEQTVEQLASGVIFKVAIGKSYFVEIAKLRALQLLWANVQESFGIQSPQKACIDVHFSPEFLNENMYTNMICATTQAMSAVIGGTTRLTVIPSDTKDGPSTDFSRRIARNVQYLLKMESYLDKVADPAAGSYFLDKLSLELAEKAWGEV